MMRFLGILLRISLSPADMGGYPAYFHDEDLQVPISNEHNDVFSIKGTKGFMSAVRPEYRMSLNRFKQIRGAFHPETKCEADGARDKCYMLRRAINQMNVCSNELFCPECNCAFDEGGISCRSRYCPCRQYNKDKPAKFRVDFFILAGSTSYVIYHIDVYQGKNACNVGIEEQCWNLPTTMKAVVNAVMQSKLYFGSNQVQGYRVLSLDNRYQCPQLAYLLLTR